MTAPPTIGVLALGNVLMKDDAFGPWVVATLQAQFDFPDPVALEDLGTPGLDLHPHLATYDRVILIDTVRSSDAPGTIKRYDREAILKHPPGTRVSPHDPGLKESLLTFQLAGEGPRSFTLIGAVPAHVDYGVGLSAPLKEAVSAAAEAVIGELEMLGALAQRKDAPRAVDAWWESRGA